MFFYTASELYDKETEKTIPLTIPLNTHTHTHTHTFWNKFNQGGERSCRENQKEDIDERN